MVAKRALLVLLLSVPCLAVLALPPAPAQAPAPVQVAPLLAGQVEDRLELKGDVQVVKVDKVVVVKEDRTVVRALPFEVRAPKGGILYQWGFPTSVVAQKKANVLEVQAAPKGPLTITAEWAVVDFDRKTVETRFAQISFDVGETAPQPPGPDPKPPVPTPTGFRVIFVRESAENMTREQLNVWNSTRIKEYLDARTAKDGDAPSWRKWDKDVQTDFAPPILRQLWSDTRPQWGTLPVLVIATDQKAVVHPFPESEDKALELLRKHGG